MEPVTELFYQYFKDLTLNTEYLKISVAVQTKTKFLKAEKMIINNFEK